MSARGRATIGLLICSVATLAAAAAAGIALARRGEAAPPSQSQIDAAATGARARVVAALADETRPLEAEVARAVQLPELRAALTERVDGATIVDLFDTEDWWTPFKSRDAAIVAGGHLLAVRGDKDLPVPAGLTSRGSDPSVSAGLLVGSRPVAVAMAPIAVVRRSEPTSLMLASPFDSVAFARSLGLPVALSDGGRLLASTGDGPQAALFATLPGKETPGRFLLEPSGQLAVAVPASANLWLWTLCPLPVSAPTGGTAVPAIWLGLTALFGVSALLYGRARGNRREADAAPAGDDPAERNSAVHIGSGNRSEPEERRSTTKMGTPRSPTTDPSVFGRYRLLRRLDGGGMADIYTAVLHGAEGFRRVFVIKRLRPELARNRSAVEQFIDEAKLGSTLVHTNIVPVFDFGKVNDEYFMAQEYILGRDITRLLQRHVERTGRPLDEKLMLYVAHGVLEALTYAHAQTDATGSPLGLVHRDVSPGNIMLTATGEVKLFDFGIVKATGRVSKTEAGVVKGNVSFMSPEQARGQPLDQRSDLFSLGLVIYYALINEPTYRAEGTFEQLLEAATGPSEEQLAKLAATPVAAKVLRRALSINPNLRYQSAAEFAADLPADAARGKAEAAALMRTLFGDELKPHTA